MKLSSGKLVYNKLVLEVVVYSQKPKKPLFLFINQQAEVGVAVLCVIIHLLCVVAVASSPPAFVFVLKGVENSSHRSTEVAT